MLWLVISAKDWWKSQTHLLIFSLESMMMGHFCPSDATTPKTITFCGCFFTGLNRIRGFTSSTSLSDRTRVPPIQLGVHVEQLLIREDPNKTGGLWTLKSWEAACSSQDAWPLLIAAYFGSLLIPCVSFHRSILSSMSWKSWICLPFFLIDCHEFFSISLDTVATFLRILIDRGLLDLGVSSLRRPQLEFSPRLIEQLTEKCCNIRQFALDQTGISCCAQTASDMSFRLFSHD